MKHHIYPEKLFANLPVKVRCYHEHVNKKLRLFDAPKGKASVKDWNADIRKWMLKTIHVNLDTGELTQIKPIPDNSLRKWKAGDLIEDIGDGKKEKDLDDVQRENRMRHKRIDDTMKEVDADCRRVGL